MDIVHGTTAAGVVSEVILDGDYQAIEVLNRDGAGEIFFTVDGAEPEVEGDDTHVLPAQIGALQVRSQASGTTAVRLISAGAVKFTVAGLS